MSSDAEKRVVDAARCLVRSRRYCKAAFVAAGVIILLAAIQAVVVGKVFMWETEITGASHHLTAALVAYAGAPLRFGILMAFQIVGLGFLVLIAARFAEHRVAGGPAIDEKLARRGTRLAKWLYRLAWIQLVLLIGFGVPMARNSALDTLKSWGVGPAEADVPMSLLTASKALTTLCTSIMYFFSLVLMALLIQVLISRSPLGSETHAEGGRQVG